MGKETEMAAKPRVILESPADCCTIAKDSPSSPPARDIANELVTAVEHLFVPAVLPAIGDSCE